MIWLVYALYVSSIIRVSSSSFFDPIMNNTCDSLCVGPESSSPLYCQCDEDCEKYGDCCLNAPLHRPSVHANDLTQFDCVPIGMNSYYMKSGCKVEWENTYISRMCAEATSWSVEKEALLSFPVTSEVTSIVYPNYFCAVCNNDALTLHTWNAVIDCFTESDEEYERLLYFFELDRNGTYQDISNYSKFQEYVKSNLIFSEDDEGFVFFINQNNSETKFHCSFSLDVPYEARICDRVVHNCSEDWNDELTESLCLSYLDPVLDMVDHTNYRNAYCALCNHVPEEDLICYARFFPYIPQGMKFFYLGLNIPVCSKDKSFVPFYNACRDLKCRFSKHGECVENSILRLNIKKQTNDALSIQPKDDPYESSVSCNRSSMFLILVPFILILIMMR